MMKDVQSSKQVKAGLVIATLVVVGVFVLSDSGKPLFGGMRNNNKDKTLIAGISSDGTYDQGKCVGACHALLPSNPQGDSYCDDFCPPTEPAEGCSKDCLGKCGAEHGVDCSLFCKDLCGQVGAMVTKDDIDTAKDAPPAILKKAQLCRSELNRMLQSSDKILAQPLPKLARYFPVSADAMVFLGNGEAVKLGRRKSVRGDLRSGMEQKFLTTSHKFAKVDDGEKESLLLVFGDNTVVSANVDPCEIEAVYHPRQDGQLNSAIAARVDANMHVMEDSKCSEGGHGCGGFDGSCCSRSSYWNCNLRCGGTSVGSRCLCK